jgi:hypothetical protein
MESATVIPRSDSEEDAQDFVMRAVEQPPDAFCLAVLAAWATQDEFRCEEWFYFPGGPKTRTRFPLSRAATRTMSTET